MSRDNDQCRPCGGDTPAMLGRVIGNPFVSQNLTVDGIVEIEEPA
jgi:hypothetical protein